MGKHRTQSEKLLGLRQRLANDEKIANREMRAAFGNDDYKIYEGKLKQAKIENDDSDWRERTAGQRKAEGRIKQALMLDGRGIDSTIWMEKAGEALGELTDIERAGMNYWENNADTGVVEFDEQAMIERGPIYVDRSIKMNESDADLKKRVLAGALDEIFGALEMDEAAKERIRKGLKMLREMADN